MVEIKYIDDKGLQLIVGKFNNLKNDFKSFKDKTIIKEIKNGENVTLDSDLYVPDGELTLTKNTKIDLGGNELTAKGGTYGDTIVIGNGANVTISNGVIKPSDSASVANASATILVKTSSETHLTLDNVDVEGVYPVYLNNANPNTEVIIKSGSFTSPNDKGVAVYVQKGGRVVIEDGYFTTDGHDSKYLLNLKDELCPADGSVDPRTYILVKGGSFENFDPSNSDGEKLKPCNFVADGYKVTSTSEDDKTVYTVSRMTDTEIITEIKKGKNFTLPDDLHIDGSNLFVGSAFANTVIDLNNHTLSATGGSTNETIKVTSNSNLTLKNGTILKSDKGQPGYGIILVATNGKLTLDNVVLSDTDVSPIMVTADEAEVTINSGVYNCDNEPAIWLNKGGEITINGGTFTSNSHAVYVEKSGKVVINGGTFGKLGETNTMLLNLKDEIRKDKDPRDFIEIFGGEFINFNPMSNVSEGASTNFVAEGYTVQANNIINDDKTIDVIYTVIKKPTDSGTIVEGDDDDVDFKFD